MVDVPLRQSRIGGDVLHAGRSVAVMRKELQRAFEDQLARLFGAFLLRRFFQASCFRNSSFRTLPYGVRGSASTKMNLRGILYRERRVLRNAVRSTAGATTNAIPASPH